MMSLRLFQIAGLLVCAGLLSPTLCADLTPDEARVVAWVDAHSDDFARDLEAAVRIDSATENLAGVRAQGEQFSAYLTALGFDSHFAPLPAETKRAGHLIAARKGTRGRRVLLLGHLDTVLHGGAWRREGARACGSGTNDMKSGDLVIIHALRALHAAGALADTQITVVMTGDEESPGDPHAISRRDLWEAAQNSDLALSFETAVGQTGTIARRGIIGWRLEVQGATGHSAGIFTPAVGAGASFEMSRILNEFYQKLSSLDGLTCNPALIVGGTEADLDPINGHASSKTNIIAQRALVEGDLRYTSPEQLDEAKRLMQDIVARHLPRTSATLTFHSGGYPAMPPTIANAGLLAQLDAASRDLGFGPISALDPKARGAGDISFVSPPLPGLDGLGLRGGGAHAPDEHADLASAPEIIKRTALLLYRLTR